MSKYGLLIDSVLCVGCNACSEACQEERNLGGDPEATKLDARNYTVLREVEGEDEVYYRRLCMHCEHPTCVSVCPVTAFVKTEAGPVIYKPERCMGCRYCMQACPYSIPKYEWHKTIPVVRKCTMCADTRNIEAGEQTACAEACPAEATVFGTREELLALARERIAEDPDLYNSNILGDDEIGGSAVINLAGVSFAKLGFPDNLPAHPLPDLTWKALSHVPDIFLVGGTVLFGLNWVIRRRIEVQEKSEGEKS